MYSLFFVFSFFVSVETETKKQKILVWLLGGQKMGVTPHLNYWGLVPGLPPESAPMEISRLIVVMWQYINRH